MTEQKTVMVFGTFDCVHPGHLRLFEQARKFGDRLVVVVAQDSNVAAIKGHQTRHQLEDRMAVVGSLKLVDEVLAGDKTDPMRRIREVGPDVICLGYDQTVYVDVLQKTFPEIRIERLEPYEPEIYKSSKLHN